MRAYEFIILNEDDEAIAHLEQVIDEGSSSIITIRDAKKALLALGFTPTGRGKGSHNVWKDEAGRLFTIPVHGKDLEYGVAKHLLKLIKNKQEQEELEEMAGEIHGGVRKALMAKGYEYLGSGIDKQAYLEPGTGQVLIVFGYRKGMKDFSPDQRMFIDWINYCNANKNNPHLPKFSGFESFQFAGKNYIQARMEALKELPDEVGDLVGQLDQVTKKKFKDYRKPLKTAAQYATFQSSEEGNSTYYELEDVINYLGGEQAAENLLQTVYQVQKFARQHRFSIDLHRGNYMARPDGTIVVNDPFVLWISSSGRRRSWEE